MEPLLRRYAEIFDYFSSIYFFENKSTNYDLTKVWTDLDNQLKRIFSLNQILDTEYKEENQFNFFENLTYFTDIDVVKLLETLKTQEVIKNDPLIWNKGFYNVHIKDAYEIKFDKLYTNVILHLNKNSYIDFFKKITHLQFVLNNFNEIKKMMNKDINSIGVSSINFYINYFYGTLPDKSKILVRKVVGIIHDALEKRYPCIHIDTDEIIIKTNIESEFKFRKDLEDTLNCIGIPYQIKEISSLIIFNNKKLIKVYKDKEVKIRGFPELNEEQLKLLSFAI